VAVEADAWWIGVGVCERKANRRVIKRCRLPSAGVVARLAGLREASSDVIRIRRALKIAQVARDTGCRREVVVVVDVAVEADAWRIGVGVCQRKAYRRMVKRRGLPGTGVVARLASLREPSSDVIWIRRPLEIAQVATHAGGARQVVVVVDVAIEAYPRWIGMRVGQRKAGAGVIELSVRPGHCVVTVLAGRRKAQLYVVHRSSGRVVILQMAGRAGSSR